MSDNSFQIYLNSKNADILKGSNTNCTFFLPNFEVPPEYYLYISIPFASIPISFYNINSSNNVLNYTMSGGSLATLTITIGNYNVDTLLTQLNSIMTGFIVTYSESLNKYIFTHTTTNFTFNESSTCFDLLGFTKIDQISNSLSIISNRCIDLLPIKAFTICSNLRTNNITKTSKNEGKVLTQIPITKSFGEIETYTNVSNFRSNLYTNLLTQLDITIGNQDCYSIDLNGVDWVLCIQFDVVRYAVD
jgi:hypothetical protein